MRSAKNLIPLIPGALFVASVLFSANAANAVVATTLFDSGGFDTSSGYSSGPTGSGANLSGQPALAPASGKFAQFVQTTGVGTINAGVFSYTPGVTPGDDNYVDVQTTNIQNGNAGYFYPQTFTSPQSPYVPASDEQLGVFFTLDRASGAVGDPFFGVTLRDGNNNTFGYAGVDGTTGAAIGLSGSPTFVAAADTFYLYEVLIDFTSKQYNFYESTGGPFALIGSAGFQFAATNFGSAPLATFKLSSATTPVATGDGIFDDYSVASFVVPEPAMLGSLGLAFLLLSRKRAAKCTV